MKILIDLDPIDVQRIQERANALGVTPGTVLREEISRKRRTVQVRERIKGLWALGWCDADIAAELGLSNQWTAELRRGMGLTANRRYVRHDSPLRQNRKTA